MSQEILDILSDNLRNDELYSLSNLGLLEYWKNILITNQNIYRLSHDYYAKRNFILILLYCITSGIGGLTTIASIITSTFHIPDYVITSLFAFSVIVSSCIGLMLYKLDLSGKASRCLDTSKTCSTIIREIELQASIGISSDEFKGIARMFKIRIDIVANKSGNVPRSISLKINRLHKHHNILLDISKEKLTNNSF